MRLTKIAVFKTVGRVMGERYCKQSKGVRTPFRSLPLLDIYISKIPEEVKLDLHLPIERRREIEAVSNRRVAREKAYATELLKYAMDRSLGLKLKRAELERLPSGKWVSPFCKFSISHSGGFCAVAISKNPVGVDIEPVVRPNSEKFAQKVLTASELSEYEALMGDDQTEFLILKWCEKESVFKRDGTDAFVPSSIDSKGSVRSQLIELDGQKFALAVSASSFLGMKINKDVKL